MKTAKKMPLKQQIERVIYQTVKGFGHVQGVAGLNGIVHDVENCLTEKEIPESTKYRKAQEQVESFLQDVEQIENRNDVKSELETHLRKLNDLLIEAGNQSFAFEVGEDRTRLFFLLEQVEIEREEYSRHHAKWLSTLIQVAEKRSGFYKDYQNPFILNERQREEYASRISGMEKEIIGLLRKYEETIAQSIIEDFKEAQRQEKLDVN
jgi:hypothetical protein